MNHKHLSTIATMCASMALLLMAAVVIDTLAVQQNAPVPQPLSYAPGTQAQLLPVAPAAPLAQPLLLEATTAPAVVAAVEQPRLSLVADPSRVPSGQSSTITWSAQGIGGGACSLSREGSGPLAHGASGSLKQIITATSSYTLLCDTPSGPLGESVTVELAQ